MTVGYRWKFISMACQCKKKALILTFPTCFFFNLSYWYLSSFTWFFFVLCCHGNCFNPITGNSAKIFMVPGHCKQKLWKNSLLVSIQLQSSDINVCHLGSSILKEKGSEKSISLLIFFLFLLYFYFYFILFFYFYFYIYIFY